MFRFAVRLRIKCDEPPSSEHLAALRGGRWEATASRRGDVVSVGMLMDSADVNGALVRCINMALSALRGQIIYAEATKVGDVIAGRRVRQGSRKARLRAEGSR